MLIRAVTVSDFKGLRGPIHFEPGAGLNVVSGPNESGKSTLMQALRAGLTLRARTGGKRLEEMRPYSGGYPRVEVRFEHAGAEARIAKHFRGPRGTTELELVHPDGRREEVSGEDAEERARELLGIDPDAVRSRNPEHLGLWPLLWIDQGDSGVEPSRHLTTQARGALDERLRELTGTALAGLGAEDVVRSVREEWERYHTSSGALKSGAGSPLQAARVRHAEAAEVLSRFVRREEQYAEDLEAFRRNESLRASAEEQLPGSEEAARRAAERRDQAREVEARLSAARVERDLARERHDQALGRESFCAGLREEMAELDARLCQLRDEREPLAEELERVRARRPRLAREEEQAARALKDARAALAARRAEKDVERARERLGEIELRLQQARAHATAALEAQRRVATTEESALDVEALLGRQRAVDDARAALAASTARLSLTAVEALDARLDGEPHTLAKDETLAREVDRELTLELGPARLVIVPGGGQVEALRRGLREAQEALARALADLGVESVEEARERRIEREHASRRLEEARRMLALVAPEGLEALEREEAGLRARIEAHAAAAAPAESGGALEQEAEEREAELAELRGRLAECEGELHRLELALAAVNAKVQEGERELEDRRRLLDAESEDGREAVREDRAARKQRLAECEALVADLERDLSTEQVENLRLDAERTRGVADSLREELQELRVSRARLEERLSSPELKRLHEGHAEAEAELAAAADELAREEHRAAVRALLFETLEEERTRARQSFLAPLKRVVEPYLQTLFATAEIDFDEEFGVLSLRRAAAHDERFDVLSGGAQEQVAVALRLALAELLAGPEGCLTVLLDDAFVATDEDRFQRVANVLRRASRRLQLVLFTCHPERYRALGVDRDQVFDLEQLKRDARRTPAPERAPDAGARELT